MRNSNADRYKYLFVNVIAFLCGSLGTKLISFFMVPLYTNILIPAEYGEIDLILSIAGVLSPFIACGIHEGIMRFSLDKGADRKLVLSIGLRVFIISSLIFLAICPILRFIPIVSDNIFFLYFYCVLNEIMTICLCYIRGKDNIKLYSFLGFLSALFTASLNVLFLAVFRWGLFGYKISMLLSPILTIAVSAVMGKILQDASLKKWDKKLASQMMQYSLILIPNSILWWCINASDRFFVSYMCGTAENGIYAVSYKIPTLLNTVASIFMQSWQMSAIKEHEEGSEPKFYNQVYRQLTFFMGLASLGLLLINKAVLSVYVGADYQSAWLYSPPLMISFFAGSLGTFWGSFYIANKNMKKYLHSAIIGAIVNVILNFVLIYALGTIGAAVATMVSYIVVMVVRAMGIQKEVSVRFINSEILSAFICMTVAMIAAYLPTYLSFVLGIFNIMIYIILNRKQIASLLKMLRVAVNRIKHRG